MTGLVFAHLLSFLNTPPVAQDDTYENGTCKVPVHTEQVRSWVGCSHQCLSRATYLLALRQIVDLQGEISDHQGQQVQKISSCHGLH